jgi:hypothetical protein
MKGSALLNNVSADGKIDSKVDLQETGCKDVDWVLLSQDSVQLRALVTAVMNTGFHIRRGIS